MVSSKGRKRFTSIFIYFAMVDMYLIKIAYSEDCKCNKSAELTGLIQRINRVITATVKWQNNNNILSKVIKNLKEIRQQAI